MKFKEICTPAKVYFFISAVAVIISLFSGFHLTPFLMKVGFVLLWTYLVNLLCKKGFKTFSWFFAFSPYIFILVGSLRNFREGVDMMAPPAGGAPAGSPDDQTINYASKIQSSEASVKTAQDAVRAAFAKLPPEQQQAIMNSSDRPAFLNA
jgi:hypothetical protein